jgi:prolyl oligopeptidase
LRRTIKPKAIYLREVVGGPSRVAIFDHDGKLQGNLPLPEVSSVNEVEDMKDGTLLASVATYLEPPYHVRYDEASGKASARLLAQTSPVSFGDAEVVREFAVWKDGTRVPLNMPLGRARSDPARRAPWPDRRPARAPRSSAAASSAR